MDLPKVPKDTSPFLWGAAVGAISLAIVGFSWGGWVTGGSAEKQAAASSVKAVDAALAPICVSQFEKGANVPASLKAFKELSSYEQSEYVGKGGWAKMPGSAAAEPSYQLVTACAEALNKLALK